ncbi:MAG: SagB/ThcOx family dehydrogenase [Elusimicrobiota bacterium]|jgi:nitroreductase|nr:SagB/ThcOx family dehydrogenase [Elusimicrobiota bacterium]
MKKILFAAAALLFTLPLAAAEAKTIELKKPQLQKGLPVMQALAQRKSVREFSAKELDIQALSNLLWAASGVNRPDGKRTAPSAMNRQEIDIYVCLKDGAYFYNAPKNILEFAGGTDCRLIGAPVTLLLVADTGKNSERWAAVDTGIVSQNISLFCAGMGLATVPRGQMPAEEFHKALGLKETQKIILNHPVGYTKEALKTEGRK